MKKVFSKIFGEKKRMIVTFIFFAIFVFSPILILHVILFYDSSPWEVNTTKQHNEIAARLVGRFVLQTDSDGTTWYIHPKTLKRHKVEKPDDAILLVRSVAVGVKHADIEKIPPSGTDYWVGQSFDHAFSLSMSGFILLDTEKNGEAWYVNPMNLQRYDFRNPSAAWTTIREVAEGISNRDLSSIGVAEEEKRQEKP